MSYQIRRRIERNGVGDLGFLVVWKFCRDARLRVTQHAHPLGVRDVVVIGIHHHQRIDVIAFALGRGSDLLGLHDRGEARRQVRLWNRIVRIVHVGERNAPIGHAACRVSLDGIPEDLLGVEIPVGMLIAHPAIEAALGHIVARGLEMNAAELLIYIVLRGQSLRS
ncbi:hypothetical protein ACVWW5_001573 [Bradyrhizobium sp. LM3.4]